MLHQAYYLVRPKEALKHHAGNLGLEDIEWLLEPELIHKDEPDRSPWRPEDHAAQVKLVYLARLRTEYGSDAGYQKVLGTERLAIETFDMWWTVEKHLWPEDVGALVEDLDPATLAALEPTGRVCVDDWIASCQRAVTGEKSS